MEENPSPALRAFREKKKNKHRDSNGYRINPKNWRGKKPARVDAILKRVLSQPNLHDKLSRYSFVTHWHEIVGSRVAQHAKPLKVIRGVLFIQVQNPVWAQELGFLKDDILTRLKSFAPSDRDLVKDIRFVVTDSF